MCCLCDFARADTSLLQAFWPAEGAWFEARIKEYSPATKNFLIVYNDGDEEWARFNENLEEFAAFDDDSDCHEGADIKPVKWVGHKPVLGYDPPSLHAAQPQGGHGDGGAAPPMRQQGGGQDAAAGSAPSTESQGLVPSEPLPATVQLPGGGAASASTPEKRKRGRPRGTPAIAATSAGADAAAVTAASATALPPKLMNRRPGRKGQAQPTPGPLHVSQQPSPTAADVDVPPEAAAARQPSNPEPQGPGTSTLAPSAGDVLELQVPYTAGTGTGTGIPAGDCGAEGHVGASTSAGPENGGISPGCSAADTNKQATIQLKMVAAQQLQLRSPKDARPPPTLAAGGGRGRRGDTAAGRGRGGGGERGGGAVSGGRGLSGTGGPSAPASGFKKPPAKLLQLVTALPSSGPAATGPRIDAAERRLQQMRQKQALRLAAGGGDGSGGGGANPTPRPAPETPPAELEMEASPTAAPVATGGTSPGPGLMGASPGANVGGAASNLSLQMQLAASGLAAPPPLLALSKAPPALSPPLSSSSAPVSTTRLARAAVVTSSLAPKAPGMEPQCMQELAVCLEAMTRAAVTIKAAAAKACECARVGRGGRSWDRSAGEYMVATWAAALACRRVLGVSQVSIERAVPGCRFQRLLSLSSAFPRALQEVKAAKVVRAVLKRLELLDRQHKDLLLQQARGKDKAAAGAAPAASSAAAITSIVERRLCIFYLVDNVLQRISKVWEG